METVLTTARTQQAITVNEAADVAAVRRAGADLAREAGFDIDNAARLALVLTEAATNILKHASHGELLMRTVHAGKPDGRVLAGIEVLALDRGPGMADANASMVDGTSTAGTYGVGLGAIARQSDALEIFSAPSHGTVLRAVVWQEPGTLNEAWEVGLVCLPMAGEHACGDAAWCAEHRGELLAMVADGLGHGELAAEAADAAVEVTRVSGFSLSPADLVQRTHGALQRTRGAALAVTRIDTEAGAAGFAGVGNITACILDESQRKHLVSHNGIVGHNLRKVQQFSLPWHHNSLLVMHSDGLGSRWDLDEYPGLTAAHPAIIAGVLYRDFHRGRDDVTVLVIRKGITP